MGVPAGLKYVVLGVKPTLLGHVGLGIHYSPYYIMNIYSYSFLSSILFLILTFIELLLNNF